MKPIDLSHIISPGMPVYPGTDQPVFKEGCSIEDDGFLERDIRLFSHTGTHIDAPAHMIKEGLTLDMLGIEHFYGSALMLDLEGCRPGIIGPGVLKPHEDKIGEVDFLLIHTGWSRYWGAEKYFSGYPVLTMEAAELLASFQLKGVGLDTISADVSDSQEYPVHKILLKKNTLIVENLTNLSSLPGTGISFSCFPLKFEEADGSPVRAVAYISHNFQP